MGEDATARGDHPLIGGGRPHRHGRATVGHLAEQIIARNPRGHLTTAAEAQALVDLLATPHHDVREYELGGNVAGMLGAPGTWIAMKPITPTASGAMDMWHVSPFVEEIFPADSGHPDPSVLGRVRAELERLLDEDEARGVARIPLPALVRLERDAFSGRDVVVFEASGGTDRFSGRFSHIHVTKSPVIAAALATMRTHQAHGEEIARRVAANRKRATQRFEEMGATVGETVLLGVDVDQDGAPDTVATVTRLEILGDALRPHTVMLALRNPFRVQKGEIDGWRVHARDHRRRTRVMAGRAPEEAMTVCAVLMASAATWSADQRRRLRSALVDVTAGREDGGRDPSIDDVALGMRMRDGHVAGTVALASGTWRGRTLQIAGTTLPDTVLTALQGRPVDTVVVEPVLAGRTIARATCDAKGRLNVVLEEPERIRYLDALGMLE